MGLRSRSVLPAAGASAAAPAPALGGGAELGTLGGGRCGALLALPPAAAPKRAARDATLLLLLGLPAPLTGLLMGVLI